MYVIGARAAGFLGGLGRMGYRPNQAVQRTYVRRRRFLGQDDGGDSIDDSMDLSTIPGAAITAAPEVPILPTNAAVQIGNVLASSVNPATAGTWTPQSTVAAIQALAKTGASAVQAATGAPSAAARPATPTLGGVSIGALAAVGGGVFLLAMLAGGGGGGRR